MIKFYAERRDLSIEEENGEKESGIGWHALPEGGCFMCAGVWCLFLVVLLASGPADMGEKGEPGQGMAVLPGENTRQEDLSFPLAWEGQPASKGVENHTDMEAGPPHGPDFLPGKTDLCVRPGFRDV